MSDVITIHSLYKTGLEEDTGVVSGKVVCISTNVHVVKISQSL